MVQTGGSVDISLSQAKAQLTELARRAEAGEETAEVEIQVE